MTGNESEATVIEYRPVDVLTRDADSRGRITLDAEYANQRVAVLVLDSEGDSDE